MTALEQFEFDIEQSSLSRIHELFANAVERFLSKTEGLASTKKDQLVLAYRVALARYVRLKIVLKRRYNNPDRYNADHVTSVYWEKPPLDWQEMHVAMYKAREDKNRIQDELIELGMSTWTLRSIRQGKWF